jgi:hypothetical protein
VTAVPEPSIAALLGIGLLFAGVSKARRVKAGKNKASLPG